MTESKKAWMEPELIVLVRSKPEEAVLESCKVLFVATNGPFQVNNYCSTGFPECRECYDAGTS